MFSLFVCDSSFVGLCYFVLSFFGGLLGFSFSGVMSMELSVPFSLFEESFYYVSVTSHGFLMLFYFLTTAASGFSNYLLPGMCEGFDMYFFQVNVSTFWGVVGSFVFVVFSLMFGEGVMAGWTLYVPLSEVPYSYDFSVDFLIVGIHVFTVSSVFGSLNNVVTIVISFNLFESLLDVSPFVWSFLVTSFLVLFSMPALSCVLTMLLFDSSCGTHFFNSDFGGDPVLFQTLFWYFGHPEVYILILPVFGVVCYVLSGVSFGFVYNKEGMVCSMLALGVLSFLVFGHHMTTMGWGVDVSSFFMSSTVAISIPTGVKIFSWLFNLYYCDSSFSLSYGLLVLFVVHFCLGGITGFFLSNSTLDFFLHDTWFVVGHLHTVLAVSAFLGFFAGLTFVFKESFFSIYVCFNIGLGFLSMFFVFSNLLFVPFHMVGVLGLPSSVMCYSYEFFFWFYVESFGFLGVWFSLVFLVIFLFCSLFSGESKKWSEGDKDPFCFSLFSLLSLSNFFGYFLVFFFWKDLGTPTEEKVSSFLEKMFQWSIKSMGYLGGSGSEESKSEWSEFINQMVWEFCMEKMSGMESVFQPSYSGKFDKPFSKLSVFVILHSYRFVDSVFSVFSVIVFVLFYVMVLLGFCVLLMEFFSLVCSDVLVVMLKEWPSMSKWSEVKKEEVNKSLMVFLSSLTFVFVIEKVCEVVSVAVLVCVVLGLFNLGFTIFSMKVFMENLLGVGGFTVLWGICKMMGFFHVAHMWFIMGCLFMKENKVLSPESSSLEVFMFVVLGGFLVGIFVVNLVYVLVFCIFV